MSGKGLYKTSVWRMAIPLATAMACFAAGGYLTFSKYQRGYRLVELDREEAWRVSVLMDVEAHDKNVTVRCMMPELVSARQRTIGVKFIDGSFDRHDEGLYSVWTKRDFSGNAKLIMKLRVKTTGREFALPAVLEWDDLENDALDGYLIDEQRIQASHEDIRAHAELIREGSDDVMSFVKDLFDYVHKRVLFKKIAGPTDAVTAYRLGEASCNGKNRLFVALARSQGIAARLAKGLVLEQGATKSLTHAWSELYLDGRWIPFCPTAGYFAEIPENYLEFPKVDQRMFKYTKNVKFEHSFHMKKGVQTVEEAFQANLDNPEHLLRAWGSIKKAEFSLDLLMVILTIPIGVTLVSFVRNVVGMVPLGTFLPALIAVSFRDTGLLWGMAMFCGIILIGVVVNEILRGLRLLHFPRLTVVLVVSVASIVGLSLLALRFGNIKAANVGMFPLAIVTLAIERISIIRDRFSLGDALKRLAVSLLVACACYVVMMSFAVRSAVLVFPELLLFCVGVNLLLGMYTGLRWTEYLRFRLVKSEGGQM